jgi:hypothetical protein
LFTNLFTLPPSLDFLYVQTNVDFTVLIGDDDNSKALCLACVIIVIIAHEGKINNVRRIAPLTAFQ